MVKIAVQFVSEEILKETIARTFGNKGILPEGQVNISNQREFEDREKTLARILARRKKTLKKFKG